MASYDRPMADDDDRLEADHNDDRLEADYKRDDKLLVLPLGEESKLITQTIANDTARQILELLADGAMSTSAIAKKLEIPLTTAQYNVEKLIEAKLVVVEKTRYSEKGREVKLYAPARRMIVLVPANTTRQAVMDVLKKYLVLVPFAGFAALMVELAMQFLNGSLPFGNPASKSIDREGGPLLTSQGGNLSSTGTSDANTYTSTSPVYPPVPEAMPNETLDGLKMGADNITAPVAGWDNVTDGANGTYTVSPNGTLPYDNLNGAINRTMETGDVSGALPQASTSPSGTNHGLIPPDLLNHYGLWFFVGCLLIIGLMIAYELYRGHSKK
jgi:predicted transcriptional regulator